MKKFKRAFTIVELVIVIAVIAILAAVLIPTFSSIIRKANVSNDTQLVRNMNTALVVDSTINGKHKTMQSALDAAFDAGYDLAKINARANQNEILWDSKNDVFCYLNVEDGVARIEYIPNSIEANAELPATSYLLWRVVRGTEEINPSEGYLQNFSVYLASDYAGSSSVSITGKGFDAGNSTVVTSVSYSGASDARNVVIRTNGAATTLTIDDASTGTIYHYGSAGALNIIKCHTASYHENGTVAFAEIAKGRIVLESGSEIKHIHVNKKDNVEEFDTIIIADNGAKVLPEAITRDQVDVSEAKPVVTVESGSSSETVYVYPYTDSESTKTGTTEQTTTQNTAIATDLGKLVLDNGSDAGEKAMSNNDKETAKTEVVNEAIESVEYAGVAVTKAGEATKLMTLEAFRDTVNAGNTYAGYTVKLLDDINLNNVEWAPIGTSEHPFSGVFDGQNYIIKNYKIRGGGKNVGLALFGCIKGTASTLTSTTNLSDFYSATNYAVNLPTEDIFTCGVKNLNVSGADVDTTANGWTAAVVAYVENATISNIRLSNSTITAEQKVGGIVGFLPDNYACYITNCTTSSDVSISAASGNHAAGILGRIDGTLSRAIISNCVNNAPVTAKGCNGSGITGQGKGALIYNCINNGNITGTSRTAGIIADSGISGITGNVIISCTNNGVITTTDSSSGAANAVGGIVAYGSGPTLVVNSKNAGNITANRSDGFIAGILANAGDNGHQIINCYNTGTLTNTYAGGNTYDLTPLTGYTTYTVTPNSAADLQANMGSNNYVLINGDVQFAENESTITPSTQKTISFKYPVEYLTLDLSNASPADGKLIVCVDSTRIVIKNSNSNITLLIDGKGNEVVYDATNTNLGSLVLSNNEANTQTNAIIRGNISTIGLDGDSAVSVEIDNDGVAKDVHFNGFGQYTLTNRGTISKTTEASNEHTVSTIKDCNITINNYGTIEAIGNSYALLFYGNSTVVFNAYAGSTITKASNVGMLAINNGPNTHARLVTINVEAGADGVSGNRYYGEAAYSSTTYDCRLIINFNATLPE